MTFVSAASLRSLSALLVAGALAACTATAADDAATGATDTTTVVAMDAAAEQDAFWKSLEGLCGSAYQGRLAQGGASDSTFRTAALVMHVRECSADTIRIPFHVGDDRSRTWVITRTADGLRLKHDHRHEDGTEDTITQYGGDSRAGTTEWQDFAADTHTAQLIPAASTNVWTVEVVPGERFAYALRREGTDRRFRVEFDLTQPVPVPPAPWGAE
ncbi:MAG TPA: hypothetical protein VGE02_07555 [Gemmatimonadales bacterium]